LTTFTSNGVRFSVKDEKNRGIIMLATEKGVKIDTIQIVLNLLRGNFFRKNRYESILSIAFWKAYWSTMRPYLIFITGSAALIGMAFIEDSDPLKVIIAFIPLLFSYGLGQALTDCFQMDTDAHSSPYRPLIRGLISRNQVLSVSLVGLALTVLILAYINPVIMIFGILSVIGLLTYTPFKKKWWGGPLWNSWIVALLPIMGKLVERDVFIMDSVRLENPRFLAFFFAIMAVFFSYANFVVMGYFKDISADRKTGYRTFPVVFGWRATAFTSDGLAFLAAVFTGCTLFAIGKVSFIGAAFFGLGLGVSLYAQVKIHRVREEYRAYRPIMNVVRVFVLFSSAVIVTLKTEWMYFIVMFYFLFEFALKNRPEETQV
jgi:geranylgeranylglycerol-phosphate geranylgeranyltransferase